ncbi:exosortase H [Marinicella sp. W31]|uniref:exosortase H n=1 Tax=Marinicella sp. W31 TaxID=3023713 RepID=UPI003757C3A1
MARFTIVFAIITLSLIIMQLLEPVQQAVILPFTASIADFCTWLVQLFDGDAVSEGNIIRSLSSGHAIQIVAGCNGVEAMIILFAALMAFPAPWFYRMKGLFWGFIAIQALNSVRIISLFYILQWNQTWFEWFHLYVWQALIILDALVVWLIWLRYLPGDKRNNPGNDDNHKGLDDLQAAA